VPLFVAPGAKEYLPATQFLQLADPGTSLYCPAAQIVHSYPSGPEYPALHLQALASALLEGASALSGHSMQVADAEAE